MLIEGWASTPHIDHAMDRVRPSAFVSSIADRGLEGPRGIKLLAQHDMKQPIGRIHTLEISERGLYLTGEIEESISYAADLAKAMRAAKGLSLSIGYRLVDVEFVDRGRDSYFDVKELALVEVSVVTQPCNEWCGVYEAATKVEKLAQAAKAFRAELDGTARAGGLHNELARIKREMGA